MERFNSLSASELARLARRRMLMRQEGLAPGEGKLSEAGAEALPDETSTTPLDATARQIIPFPTHTRSQEGGERETQSCSLLPAPVAPAPLCSRCLGAGYTRVDVPYGHPDFGKPRICTCKAARKHEARRALLWQQSNIDQLVAFQEASFETFEFWREGVEPAYEKAVQWANTPQGWLILAGGN